MNISRLLAINVTKALQNKVTELYIINENINC